MFDLEKAIKNWKRDLRKGTSFEDGYIEELESHLRDEIEKIKENITVEEAAFQEAVKSVGSAIKIADEYSKSDKPSHQTKFYFLSLLPNYVKVGLRNAGKHKSFSFINILGLALGMACCILIMLWVQDEMNYDNFHTNGDRIYRVLQDIKYSEVVTWAITQGPVGPGLKKDFPEIEDAARFAFSRWTINYNGKDFNEPGCFADKSIFEIFSFPLADGNPDDQLVNPHSVVLSESLARKLFNTEDPIGKIVKVNDNTDLTVTGIFADIPRNSHLRFEYVSTMEYAKENGRTVDLWNNSTFYTYVLLSENVTQAAAAEKIYNYLDDKPTLEEWEKLTLQPLEEIHFSSGIGYDYAGTGNFKYVVIFFSAGVFILLIACINFINLTTARSAIRAKEVGMRKVVGASRSELIRQFLGESIVLSLTAFILGFIISLLLVPLFNDLSGKNFNYEILLSSNILLGLLIMIVLTGLISGGYPALYLSSFKPLMILKSTSMTGNSGSFFRKMLVVFQFSISVLLLICTLVVFAQISYMKNKKLGYEKENLIFFNMHQSVAERFDSFREEMLNNPNIQSISASASIPTYGITFSNARWKWGDMENFGDILFRTTFVDYDFFDTYKMKIVNGRGFSKDFPSDSTAIIINETARAMMGIEEPVGAIVRYPGSGGDYPLNIIGVVEDYNFRSLHSEVEPLILLLTDRNSDYVTVRINSNYTEASIDYMQTVWKKYAGDKSFNYAFLDDYLARLYENEQRIEDILKSFSLLAIVISSLGLFGLSSYMTLRRTKEIGIRKVLGATVKSITLALTKEFFKWVVIANVITWPLAYWSMSEWLKQFPYRTEISLWFFAAVGFTTLSIAIITVGYQAIKSATANPVTSLRYE